jgi:hypothetical protein
MRSGTIRQREFNPMMASQAFNARPFIMPARAISDPPGGDNDNEIRLSVDIPAIFNED